MAGSLSVVEECENLLTLQGQTLGKRLERLRLRVIDASCSTCVIPVRRTLEKALGVEWVGANPVLDLISVDYDPSLTNPDRILSEVKKTGYTAVRATT
jgi:copper chaperone CopZ